MDLGNESLSIHSCQFAIFVQKAKVQIKFPCNYFIEWKASNGKIIESSKNRYQANKSEILFNETLNMNVNILYDKANKKYLKKQSLLLINLISKSRPDQIKLVGRVLIDLAQVLNSAAFKQMTTSQLEYCSVEASVNFNVKSISVKQSTMNLSELDRSSFNEYMSFQTHGNPYKQFINRQDGSNTHRDFDEVGSMRGSDKGEIRSLGRDRSRMSSSSLNRQSLIPGMKSIVRNESILSNYVNRSNKSSRILLQNEANNNKQLSPKSSIDPVPQQPLIQRQLLFAQVNQVRRQQQVENNFSFNKNVEEEVRVMGMESAFLQKLQENIGDYNGVGDMNKMAIFNIDQKISIDQQINNTKDLKQKQETTIKQTIKENQFSTTIKNQQYSIKKQQYQKKKQLNAKDSLVPSMENSNVEEQQVSNKHIHKINTLEKTVSNNNPLLKIDHHRQTVNSISKIQISNQISPVTAQYSNHIQNSLISSTNELLSSTNIPQLENNPYSPNSYSQTAKLTRQLQKSKSESKRIIGLTEALNELETKYTKLTFQTQQTKKSWRKEKQLLLLNIDKQTIEISQKQKRLNYQQKQLSQKEKLLNDKENKIKDLEHDKLVIEKKLSENIEQLDKVEKQLKISQRSYLALNEQNSSLKDRISDMECRMMIANQSLSLGNEEISKSFNLKLAESEQKIHSLQNQLLLAHQSNQKLVRQNTHLTQNITQLQSQIQLKKIQAERMALSNKQYQVRIQQLAQTNSQLSNKNQRLTNQYDILQQQLQKIKTQRSQSLSSQKSQLLSSNHQSAELKKLQSTFAEQLKALQLSFDNQLKQKELTLNKEFNTKEQALRQQIKMKEQVFANELKMKEQVLTDELKKKDQLFNQRLQQKQQQLTVLKEQIKNQTKDNNEKSKRIEQLEMIRRQLQTKNEQLNTTLLTKNSDISQLQSKLFELNQKITQKQLESQQLTLSHQKVSQKQIKILTEHQQLLFSLNAQIEHTQNQHRQSLVKISSLQQVIAEKQQQIIHSQQLYQSLHNQNQILKAQAIIYEQKTQQIQDSFNEQLQAISLNYNKKMRSLQMTIQQQLEKQQQLLNINRVLNQAVQQWQTKWSDDKIVSSKTVAALNDIVKEKQSTMQEMENMMRTLEKQKTLRQDQIINIRKYYSERMEVYNQAIESLNEQIKSQQTEFLSLFSLVRDQRYSLNQKINQKEKIMLHLQEEHQKIRTQIQEMKAQNSTISQQLHNLQRQSDLEKKQHQLQISSLKTIHSQQIHQYQEQLRQLNNQLDSKDNEIIEKEMILVELQKNNSIQIEQQVSSFKNQLQQKYQQIDTLQKQKENMTISLNLKQQQLQSINRKLKEQKTQNDQYRHQIQKQSLNYQQVEKRLQDFELIMNDQIQKLKQEKQCLIKQLREQNQTMIIRFQQQKKEQITKLQQQNQTRGKIIQQEYEMQIKRLIEQSEDIRKQAQEQIRRTTEQMENKLIDVSEHYEIRLRAEIKSNEELSEQISRWKDIVAERQLQIEQYHQQYQKQAHQLSLQGQHQLQIINEKCNTLSQQNQALLQSNENLSNEILSLKQQLAQSKELIETIRKDHYLTTNELNQLKTDRLSYSMINFKEQTQKLKTQIHTLTEQNLSLNNQLKLIPQLERSLKIKTIENNSLKFKSINNTKSQQQQISSHYEQIISIKDEELLVLKQQNLRISELQLQLYQVQTINQGLNQDIEQYEQQKFHLHSEMNQKDIKIAELQQQITNLTSIKKQLQQKTIELNQKVKQYETLILNYKGQELSSTKTQSQKFYNSQASSNKNIKILNNDIQSESNQNLLKKIKYLESQILNINLRQQQLLKINQQQERNLNQCQGQISQLKNNLTDKQNQLTKTKNNPSLTQKSILSLNDPHQVGSLVKQIQNVLTKRSQFHSLQNSLLKIIQTQQDFDKEVTRIQNQQNQKILIKENSNDLIGELWREFQNLKAKIMKMQGKNYQEKAKLISLLRPIQERIKKLVNIFES